MASRLTDEMVDDILCTALEGGSNYWTRLVSCKERWPEGAEYLSQCLTRGRSLGWLTDDGERYTLTLPKMRRGIYRAARHFGLAVERFYEEHDATGADVAVQFALLGEIVYG